MLPRNSCAYKVKCIRTKAQKYILDIFQLDWYLTPLYSFVIRLLWRVFDIRILRLESTVAIMILLVSISWIFSLHVNVLYATPDHSPGNATSQPLTNDNSTTSSAPSVLHLSTVPSNNGTSSTSEPSTNNKADTSSATSSNSGTAHQYHGTSTSSTSSTSNHHNDNTKSHDLAHKIINKIKQKFKVGDVPFP